MAPEQESLLGSDADFSFRAGDQSIHDLGVVSFKLTEGFSRLFRLVLDLACEDRNLELEKIVGRPAALRIRVAQQQVDRFVNGIVSRFEYVGEGTRLARYECEVVPLVWLLGLRVTSRIFQNLTAIEIVKQVMADSGIPADTIDWRTTREPVKREYCVQYRESEWNFISRLMEEEGIYYYFTHVELAHKIVFADNKAAHVAIPGTATIPFRPPSQMVQGEEYVSHLRSSRQVRPGGVMLKDFTFEDPKRDMKALKTAPLNKELEIYDYPGEFQLKADGETLADIRLGELQAQLATFQIKSIVRNMIPGFRFTLEDHPRDTCNIEYLITSVTHQGSQPSTLEEEAIREDNAPNYENFVEAIPQAVLFRPRRVTRRPVVEGPQTAIVVGPSGEEIYTDEYGRVKVHFHWDREGVFDEKASCWIRVSQGWAGGKYGMFFLPRIAHEVIVDFIEGDPDQPIITGRVHNKDEMPPYKLPDEKTKSTIRTASSKEQKGANELRFEDKAGSEQIFIHGEKDIHVRAKASRVVTIGGSDHLTVGYDGKGDRNTHIEGDHSLYIKGNEMIAIEKEQSIHVTELVSYDFAANHAHAVGGDYLLDVTGKILIKGGAGIRLEGPGGSITIASGGVYIVGTKVYINSGDSALSVDAGQCVAPKEPAVADTETPGRDTSYTGQPRPPEPIKPEVLKPKSWIGLELKDQDGKPVPGERYILVTSDNEEIRGTLDGEGKKRIEGIEPGTCKVNFPNRQPDEWHKA